MATRSIFGLFFLFTLSRVFREFEENPKRKDSEFFGLTGVRWMHGSTTTRGYIARPVRLVCFSRLVTPLHDSYDSYGWPNEPYESIQVVSIQHNRIQTPCHPEFCRRLEPNYSPVSLLFTILLLILSCFLRPFYLAFFEPIVSHTNVHARCGRSWRTFLEQFWLRWFSPLFTYWGQVYCHNASLVLICISYRRQQSAPQTQPGFYTVSIFNRGQRSLTQVPFTL